MPSFFDKAIPVIMRHEGGYANNPNDPGGATNYGISIRWLSRMGHGVGDFTHDGTVDVRDIKAMTPQDAINLYRTYWWDRFKFEDFTFQALATKMFDGAVNMGVGQVTKLLQRSLVKLGAIYLKVDGVLGPQTIQRANNYCNGELALHVVETLADTEVAFYMMLADEHKPKFDGFLTGWVRRAKEIDG